VDGGDVGVEGRDMVLVVVIVKRGSKFRNSDFFFVQPEFFGLHKKRTTTEQRFRF
jgi:hypothetical protein